MVLKMFEPLKFYLHGKAGTRPNTFCMSELVYIGGEGAKINGHPSHIQIMLERMIPGKQSINFL